MVLSDLTKRLAKCGLIRTIAFSILLSGTSTVQSPDELWLTHIVESNPVSAENDESDMQLGTSANVRTIKMQYFHIDSNLRVGQRIEWLISIKLQAD